MAVNFGVFFPNQSVDVGDRFFFFNSLFSKHTDYGYGTGAQLGGYARDIVMSGLSDLNNSKNAEGLTIMAQSLAFLKAMAEHQA